MNHLDLLTIDNLIPLVGTWIGTGKGTYPTIDSFHFRETLIISREHTRPFLAYRQDTEIIDPQGQPVRKSHWETGILRTLENGTIELACVQGSGRLELLEGRVVSSLTDHGGIQITFNSRWIGNDERVSSSSRIWSLKDSSLNYTMTMATSKIKEPTLHIEASLTRTDPGEM